MDVRRRESKRWRPSKVQSWRPKVQSMTAPEAATAVQARPTSIETRSLAPLASTSARAASVKANGLDASKAPPAAVASLPAAASGSGGALV